MRPILIKGLLNWGTILKSALQRNDIKWTQPFTVSILPEYLGFFWCMPHSCETRHTNLETKCFPHSDLMN